MITHKLFRSGHDARDEWLINFFDSDGPGALGTLVDGAGHVVGKAKAERIGAACADFLEYKRTAPVREAAQQRAEQQQLARQHEVQAASAALQAAHEQIAVLTFAASAPELVAVPIIAGMPDGPCAWIPMALASNVQFQ